MFSSDVSPDRLGRIERGEHPIGQVPFGIAISPRHRGPDLVVQHQICFDRELFSLDVPGGGDALLPGVSSDVAARVNHGDLSDRLARIGREDSIQRLARGLP